MPSSGEAGVGMGVQAEVHMLTQELGNSGDELRGHNIDIGKLGDATFVERLEKLVGRVLRPRKRGRKPRFPK
jgi:hypothetical protein